MEEAVAINPWAALAYLVAGVCFILALRGLSSPTSSQRGNRFGMVTGNHATVYFTQLGAAFRTQCRGKWATPVERAARRRIQRRG